MTEGDMLYQAILKEPDENDLRLIYADWLEDNGQPGRAEFIRVQVALDDIGDLCECCKSDCLACQLQWRQASLWDESDTQHGWRLMAQLPPIATPARWNHGIVCLVDAYDEGNYYALYRRGFLDEVRAPFAILDLLLPDIVAAHPVTRVVPTDRKPSGSAGAYFWHDSNRDFGVIRPGTSYVTERACDEMEKDGWTYNLLLRTSSLETEEKAFDALSRAMLRIARSEAGV